MVGFGSFANMVLAQEASDIIRLTCTEIYGKNLERLECSDDSICNSEKSYYLDNHDGKCEIAAGDCRPG